MIGHEVVITIDIKRSNIPTVFDSALNYDKNKSIIFHYMSGLSCYDIIEIYSSEVMIAKEVTINISCKESVEAEFEHYSHITAVHE